MKLIKINTDKVQAKTKVIGPICGLILVSGVMLSLQSNAQTSPPPSMGEETKGAPAVDERAPIASSDKTDKAKPKSVSDSVLGTAKVKESKRENGQRYLIELEHSTGAKQYIEEIDSDGKIESTSNDIEETPNLPKWKIGSW